MRVSKSIFTSVFFCALATSASAQWIKQEVNTTANFRGLAVVNEKIIWASGTGGTVIRTIDSGQNWSVMTVPGAEKLDFRDIEAFDANTAYILSIGNGENSRIYKTTDGGKSWNLQFSNPDEKAFFDAIACWDRNHCIAVSDPVAGKFPVLTLTPLHLVGNVMNVEGVAWLGLPHLSSNPIATKDEAAFAASGTCLVTQGQTNAFLVSGGANARVFRSADRGLTWMAADTTFVRGIPGSGIFSIAMLDGKNGVIVGGNYEKPDEHDKNLAFTKDGGETWKLGTGLSGYRSGVAYVNRDTIIAVGTNGTDLSRDGGKTWTKVGNENMNAVQAKGRRSIWAAGPNGLVMKFKS
jgi:photosystem II stability/assembly factor-like uncharacterized protein